MEMLLRGAWVYAQGRFSRCDIAVENGVVRRVAPFISPQGFDSVLQLNNRFIVPGLVDVHVHLRQPGFSYKETIATGTLAGARGGYTALCAMPNLMPVPDCPEALELQLEIIKNDAVVKVYPYAAITLGQKGQALAPLEELGRAVGFSDDGKGVQSPEIMESAMEWCARHGAFIAAHCEDEGLLAGGYIHDGQYAREHGHSGICSQSEWGQLKRDIELVRKTGCRYHVCHVSSKESVELIRRAKAEGLPITSETAPHYLLLSDDMLQDEGRYKMNPPIRARADRDALIAGLGDGTIDMIATDHAPHSAEEKSKGLRGSLMGVVGLETAFGALYTGLVKKGTITLEKLIALMSDKPRRLLGLQEGITQGGRADLAVLDLDRKYVIRPENFASMGRATPFEGMEVTGACTMTMVDGRVVWKDLQES